MADAFVTSRNLRDANIDPAAFALPAAAAASVTSAVIDLGDDTYKNEHFELELSVPALSTTIAPDTRTYTYLIESSTTSNFAAVDQTLLTVTGTGAASAGIGALVKRVRVPSNCARYVRAKLTAGASTTDASALSATFTARF